MKILAGIVLFNPDLDRLKENVQAIKSQVDEVIFFNNGSPVSEGIDNGFLCLDANGRNIGIASALNLLCQYALDHSFDWVLTLDQDSICPEGLIDEYKKYLDDSSIGMLCPCIIDRNYGSCHYDGQLSEGLEDVDACITSGSLIRLSAWQLVTGFWDDLFIDMVDFVICWSLRAHGYRIVRVRAKALFHEIGHSKKVNLFGKEEAVFNHSPIRSYYMARNAVAVGRKHHRLSQCLRWTMKRFLLVNLYEKNRWKKDIQFFKGLIDGIRMAV